MSTSAGPSPHQEGLPAPMVTTVRAVCATTALLAFLVCSARIYVRACVIHAFGIDDVLVVVALIMVLLFAVVSIALTFYGIGRHMADVPVEQLPTMQYIAYISYCIYLFVASSVKISLTVFIMRIFPTPAIRRFGFGIITFLILFAISGELPLILQCTPVAAAYDKTIVPHKCFSSYTLFAIQMYQGVLMFVIDLVIFILPIPTTWRLQMPIQRRLSIIGLFAIGLTACVAGLVRLPTLVYTKNISDFTYAGATPLIWMNVEFGLALVAGSLPSLRLLLKFIPGMWSQNSNSRSNDNGWSTLREHSAIQLSSQKRWTQNVLGKRSAEVETLHSLDAHSQEQIVYPGRTEQM